MRESCRIVIDPALTQGAWPGAELHPAEVSGYSFEVAFGG